MRLKTVAVAVLGFSLAVGEALFRPDSYKSWHHVKSMVIHSEEHPLYEPFGGIHHVYANDVAFGSVKEGKGRRFPDGSVLVFLLYDINRSKGAFEEGRKKIEAFMVKDSRRFKDTGGWGFYAYDGQGRPLVRDMVKDCFSCHARVKDMDYVFSRYKE
ncbi:MAG: cytochrome P460 family protein [Aquificota bacterium]|nr:cytochrome P460 family protein [Aquificota bacterium]